jgi:pre-mRNA-splicing factor 18
MDAIAAAIKKRQQQGGQSGSGSGGGNGSGNQAASGAGAGRWVRRGDAARVRDEKYRAEQAARDAARLERKRALDREREEEEKARQAVKRRKRGAGPDDDDDGAGATGGAGAEQARSGSASSVEQLMQLDLAEILRRLRFRGEPVTLFGEEGDARVRRLHQHEVLKPVDYEEITSETHDEYGRHLGKGVEDDRTRRLLVGKDEDVIQYSRPIDETLDYTTHELHAREDVIAFVVRKLLFNWGADVSQMSDDEKRTMSGRNMLKNYKDCRGQLQPLLKKLQARKVDADEVDKLYGIVSLLQLRKYADANQVYLLLAIGNQAWPMGVTMVGIHERAARARIAESSSGGVAGARIMQDETHRKYLHGFKRLMTQCQERYPSADPDQVWMN